MRALITLVVLMTFSFTAIAAEKMWVTSDRLNRRTCPSTDCGVVGQLFYREGVTVLEHKDGWARITRRYDAACTAGRSSYVDSGNNSCTPQNGITSGQFSEWVAERLLSHTRPTDPASTASSRERLVMKSDDFRKFRQVFIKAAEELILSGRCREKDFIDNGGWVSSTKYRNKKIYFTYCGGYTRSNQIYLDAETGQIFH